MLMCSMEVTMDALIAMLRAAGDPTRLRLLLLLRQAELTVSELIEIVGQSQPRVSRHLKLLCEAELLERFKEGSWVFYRASEQGKGADFAAAIAAIARPDSAILASDRQRLAAVREARAAQAAAYFRTNAAQWERIRALHAPEKDADAGFVAASAATPLHLCLAPGTGPGPMPDLRPPYVKRATGVNAGGEMLAIARAGLTRAHVTHPRFPLGDVYRLLFPSGS